MLSTRSCVSVTAKVLAGLAGPACVGQSTALVTRSRIVRKPPQRFSPRSYVEVGVDVLPGATPDQPMGSMRPCSEAWISGSVIG